MMSKTMGSEAFFRPIITLAQNAAEVLKEIDIGASSADHGELVCFRRCQVVRVGIIMTSEAASGTSVAPRAVFTKRPTPLSATGEVVIGTAIVPTGTAIGKSTVKVITPVTFNPGDSLEISHVIGTGTPTGQGVWFVEAVDHPEADANLSDVVSSA